MNLVPSKGLFLSNTLFSHYYFNTFAILMPNIIFLNQIFKGEEKMEISIYEITLVPLISGLVEVIKQVGIPKKYSSILSIIFGVLLGMIYAGPTDLKRGIIMGIMLGLSASGLYSGTRSVHETIKQINQDKVD